MITPAVLSAALPLPLRHAEAQQLKADAGSARRAQLLHGPNKLWAAPNSLAFCLTPLAQGQTTSKKLGHSIQEQAPKSSSSSSSIEGIERDPPRRSRSHTGTPHRSPPTPTHSAAGEGGREEHLSPPRVVPAASGVAATSNLASIRASAERSPY